MSEYTPTTKQVRNLHAFAYAWRSRDDTAEGETDLSELRTRQRAEFDRWLSSVIAAAKAEQREEDAREKYAEITDSMVANAARALDVHRWKDMGIDWVSCECGARMENPYADPLTAFPADVAFRAHLARAAIRAAGGSDE